MPTAQTLHRLRGGVQIRLNVETSVVGMALVEVQRAGRAVRGFSAAEADPIKGNVLGAVASWRGGTMASVSGLAAGGEAVALKVTLVDAELFAIRVRCSEDGGE